MTGQTRAIRQIYCFLKLLYQYIIKHFINCIEKDKLPKVPLAEGIYTLKVALAIKKSINSSKNILIK